MSTGNWSASCVKVRESLECFMTCFVSIFFHVNESELEHLVKTKLNARCVSLAFHFPLICKHARNCATLFMNDFVLSSRISHLCCGDFLLRAPSESKNKKKLRNYCVVVKTPLREIFSPFDSPENSTQGRSRTPAINLFIKQLALIWLFLHGARLPSRRNMWNNCAGVLFAMI